MRAHFASFVMVIGVAAACGDNNSRLVDAAAPQCADGIDNDGDGKIDFPADPGCESAEDTTEDSTQAPACSDGRDNDGDGKADYPNDPGCVVPQSDSEADDCPGGVGCPQCADGIDNDGNGKTDFPDDPGCAAAGQRIEFADSPDACGPNLNIKPLPPTGIESGMLSTGSVSSIPTTCGNMNGAPGVAYVIHLTEPKVLVATTNDISTTVDTILDLRTANCAAASSEVVCHDDLTSTNKKSQLTRSLLPGTYYLIVEGNTAADVGPYFLRVELFPGQGSACQQASDCGAGLLCRVPHGSTMKQCMPPVCSDNIDDDGDGLPDYPRDPGCASPTDDTEDDPCPIDKLDPGCPACSNGIDDDGDGLIDYPNDPTCIAASVKGESCIQSEPLIIATTAQTTGTTVGATDDYRPPPGQVNGHACSSTSTTISAPDRAVQFDVPAMQTLSVRLNPVSFDSAHLLLDGTCGGTPIDCRDDPNAMAVTNLARGRYYVVVDGWSSGSGTFTLNLAGTIANGESCEDPLAQSGAIVCGAAHACKGTPGSRTCQPAQCSDGVDNNGDNKIDFPADPGCQTASDDDEDTVCPGPACPACSDMVDNDGDGLIDYPMDTGCASAAATNEGCRELDPMSQIASPTTTGTLVGAHDDHDPSCVASNQPDVIYMLQVTVPLKSLVIDTRNSVVDTVLSLMNNTCGEPSMACDNDGAGSGDSLITRGLTQPGSYTIAIDANTATLDTYELHVSGTIATGSSCEDPLIQTGVIHCDTGMACNGPLGQRRCSPAQCSDGIDNNGDGKTDYPVDPGCDTPSDNAEITVCPGPACPVCSDGIDNDMDGATDYPADIACKSAAGTSETCVDSDPIEPVTQPTINGTLVGAIDDQQPTCSTSKGVDRVFSLSVPRLQSLTVDTIGSVTDTVLSLMNSACGAPDLGCDDDGGGAGDSLISRGATDAGTYMIGVNAFSTTLDTFVLNVKGVIASNASCESPLVGAGVLSCPSGMACKGALGSRKCALAQCADGIDNNGDGKTDYPEDPGCDSAADDSENTVCPGPTCPVCSDGIDNDSDGQTDYPNDSGCQSAAGTSEGCQDTEPVVALTQPITTGTLIGATNDRQPTCVAAAGVDIVYNLTLPTLSSLTIDTEGSVVDTVLSLLDASCAGTVACDDDGGVGVGDSLISRGFTPAGQYTLAVDAKTATPNTYIVNLAGVIAPGASCESPLFTSGALTCSNGFACAGTPGAQTCVVAQCLDGQDNNGDGLIDYPDDPGCESPSDNTETTVCPGPECPTCSDTLDNNANGKADYPMDPSCASASGIEACSQTEAIGRITKRVTSGNTAGQSNDYKATCGSSTATAPDLAYQLVLPAMQSLQLNTTGFDTAHSLLDSTCGGTPIGCSDPPSMSFGPIAAGTYYVMIDGWSSGSGPFTLTTLGVIAPGGSCETPLYDNGAFTCAYGTACSGTAGARTCAPTQCNDGLDNNGDGLIDAFDPGCASGADLTEDTVCPGPMCPVCSNTMDDDMDMAIDFPADFGCTAAGSTSEAFCPVETDPVAVITAAATTGTLASPATDNYEQTCQTSTGNDKAYALQLPVPVVSLQLDTLGSTATNTVLSLWEASCGIQLGCDDDGAPGTDNRSVLVVPSVPAGNYAIQVDSFGSSNNLGFTLNVKGTVAPGTACTDPLFTAGVLVCPAGTSCTAGTCQ